MVSKLKLLIQMKSLNDMGIDIQKYRMRFHERSQFIYDGAYTYNAFSDLHEIDVVYPETIYTYSCIYYKDNKAEENRLGASAFSCSISDWNPDWDVFIETSWQMIDVPGSATTTSGLVMRDQPDRNEGTIIVNIPNGTKVEIMSEQFENGTVNWYKVRWGEYEGYCMAQYLRVSSEYGGKTEINPTLYRDTATTLTWDYFGFDRDIYRPAGYGEGIYLWNPRSWDKDNIKFSFEELIRCGTQYVVYPIWDPDTYKIWVQRNYLGRSYTSSYTTPYTQETTYQTSYWMNPGIEIDLSAPDRSA